MLGSTFRVYRGIYATYAWAVVPRDRHGLLLPVPMRMGYVVQWMPSALVLRHNTLEKVESEDPTPSRSYSPRDSECWQTPGDEHVSEYRQKVGQTLDGPCISFDSIGKLFVLGDMANPAVWLKGECKGPRAAG
jgi:hypothetical protein